MRVRQQKLKYMRYLHALLKRNVIELVVTPFVPFNPLIATSMSNLGVAAF
jgi:hypothetical protein